MKIFKDDRQYWLTWRISMIIFNLMVLFLYVLVFFQQELSEVKHSKKTNGTHLSHQAALKVNGTEYEVRRKHDVLGGWKYLTRWNHIIQIFTFAFTFVPHYYFLTRNVNFFRKLTRTDEIKQKEVSTFERRYMKIFDSAFHSLTVTCAIFVTFSYWVLRAIDPNLVLNKNPDHRSPWFIDHVLHSAITPITLIELIFVYHERPKLVIGLSTLFTFFAFYNTVTFANGILANIWAYGILEKLNWPLRTVFVLICLLIFLLFYIIGCLIHKYFWSDESRKNFFLFGIAEKDKSESIKSQRSRAESKQSINQSSAL